MCSGIPFKAAYILAQQYPVPANWPLIVHLLSAVIHGVATCMLFSVFNSLPDAQISQLLGQHGFFKNAGYTSEFVICLLKLPKGFLSAELQKNLLCNSKIVIYDYQISREMVRNNLVSGLSLLHSAYDIEIQGDKLNMLLEEFLENIHTNRDAIESDKEEMTEEENDQEQPLDEEQDEKQQESDEQNQSTDEKEEEDDFDFSDD